MPVLPPQSPARVGEEPAAVPAIVMSRKSQSVADRLLTVSVRVVPRVSERTKIRRTAEAPATVSVPLMVWLALKVHCIKPADAGAVNVKLLNVFVPVTACVAAVVPVSQARPVASGNLAIAMGGYANASTASGTGSIAIQGTEIGRAHV